ncbi:hypothetical protein MUY27_08130 [Mucilaginibacter sp. RS28]|uniref:Uncharacterized protein n=1 Tax=Mucilaginibacter straminoryzae TaxID=2932774 RepID=A0A9X2BCV2_9SPHI|nr:hypothetical protein [Mucilaginibacter straminoryzae]MCJ8209673.1 hypothetical protein [Mucilaginibacter straminoryzae]
MIYHTDLMACLLAEQSEKKAELDRHIQFDWLGVDDTYAKTLKRYHKMKKLAKRIIQIQNLVDNWSNCAPLPEILGTGVREITTN